MIKGIWSSMAGMIPRLFYHEVSANNLANITTTGYKGDRAFLKSFIDAEMMAERNANVYHRETQVEAVNTDFSQGLFEETSNPLDVAILGEGFFCISTPQGELYSRNGNFKVDKNYRLVNSEDLPVLGVNGKTIQLSDGDIFINEQGEISIDGETVAKLKIVDFPQPYALKKSANNLFEPESPSDPRFPAKDYQIKHGFLERSNVIPIREMLNSIIYFRNYEADTRILMAQDDTLRLAVNDVGRVS
jgi:flagellar basal-body rod protein FlgG